MVMYPSCFVIDRDLVLLQLEDQFKLLSKTNRYIKFAKYNLFKGDDCGK